MKKYYFLKFVYFNNGFGFYINYSLVNWVKFDKDIYVFKYMWKIRKKNMCIIYVV